MAAFIPSIVKAKLMSKLDDKSSSLINDSSLVSKISYQTSPAIIGGGLLLITYMQFVETPMSCFYADSKLEWKDFINHYCWLQSHYQPINSSSTIQSSPIESKNQHHAAFQWAPFILFVQIILFSMPHKVWEIIFLRSSLNPASLLRVVVLATESSSPEERLQKLDELRAMFQPFIKRPDEKEDNSFTKKCCKKSRCKKIIQNHKGIFLVMANVFVRCLYIGNAFGQIIFISSVFSTSSIFYGIDVAKRIFHGMGSEMPESFPRVVNCNLLIPGSVVTKPIQCTIAVNMFNEYLFIFLWFWCTGLGCIGILTLIYDVLRQATLTTTKGFINKDLKLLRDKETKENRLRALVFVRENMRRDGIHMLDLISSEVSQLVVGELVIALWREWVEHVKKKLQGDTGSIASDELMDQIETTRLEVDEPINKNETTIPNLKRDYSIDHGRVNEGAEFDGDMVHTIISNLTK